MMVIHAAGLLLGVRQEYELIEIICHMYAGHLSEKSGFLTGFGIYYITHSMNPMAGHPPTPTPLGAH